MDQQAMPTPFNKEQLEANAILRERFLHFLNWTAGKQVTIKMFNGSQAEPVEGTMAAVDAHNFENFLVNGLVTPIGQFENAALRIRDTEWMKFKWQREENEEIKNVQKETKNTDKMEEEKGDQQANSEKQEPKNMENGNTEEESQNENEDEKILDNIFKPWEENREEAPEEEEEDDKMSEEVNGTKDSLFETAPSTPIPTNFNMPLPLGMANFVNGSTQRMNEGEFDTARNSPNTSSLFSTEDFRCPPSPALSTTSSRAKRASVASRFSSPAIRNFATSNKFFGQFSQQQQQPPPQS